MGTNPKIIGNILYKLQQFLSWKDIWNASKETPRAPWRMPPQPIASLVTFPKFDLTEVSFQGKSQLHVHQSASTREKL